MPTTFPLAFSDAGFPDPFTGDPQDFVDNFLAYMAASITSDNLLLGQIGGAAPTTNVGPWLDSTVWKIWNSGLTAYTPAIMQLEDPASPHHLITFASDALTADRTVQFRDLDGVVAMLSDVYSGRGTTVLTGATPVIDWSVSATFYQTTTGTITPTIQNSLPGQRILYLVAGVTAAAITWTGAPVMWPGGTAPTQSANGTDLYELFNLAGTIYGQRLGAAFA